MTLQSDTSTCNSFWRVTNPCPFFRLPVLLLSLESASLFLTALCAVQSFAEKLFTQLNVRYKKETWETRLAMITVTARVIGVHKLLMDEKYYAAYLNLIQPRQRDITHVLAALIMVSPQALTFPPGPHTPPPSPFSG